MIGPKQVSQALGEASSWGEGLQIGKPLGLAPLKEIINYCEVERLFRAEIIVRGPWVDADFPLDGALAGAQEAMLCKMEGRSEEHTSELQSLMRISYAVFCLKKKTTKHTDQNNNTKLSDKT